MMAREIPHVRIQARERAKTGTWEDSLGEVFEEIFLKIFEPKSGS